ncbi:hypothetical protein DAPPUDRAFT_310363 [Daphnia pulex]|uniref:Uncharacterized protein n=1 Tax=Daphnia pulex TaxID=6669 RepID=E9FTD3_DAPPU|nr:hypothetical protein DAPPUDRAFT_310363 [Daphnia pulex]|eukprot:EFX89660.1 hypothetical protein DAPPUDRAFT_310363 [Daphnia pulex]
MDENTKMLKSGTQMQQLSYNSTATSGLHCNRMLLQWFNLSSSHLSPFGCNKKHTEMFMMKNRENGIKGTSSITPHVEIKLLMLKKV